MSKRQKNIGFNNQEARKLKSFISWTGFLVISFFLFFPFSLIYFFFFWKIKKYILDNINDLKLSEKFSQIVVENKEYMKHQAKNNSSNHNSQNQIPNYRKNKIDELNERLEEKRDSQSSFYEQNKKNLQSKLQHEKKKSYAQSNINISNPKESTTAYSSTSKNNNFFWNNKQNKTFWNGKSIWDDYESVTEKFSSNKK